MDLLRSDTLRWLQVPQAKVKREAELPHMISQDGKALTWELSRPQDYTGKPLPWILASGLAFCSPLWPSAQHHPASLVSL